ETWTYSTFKTKLPAKFPKIYKVGFEKNDDGDYKMDADGRELLSALRGLEPRDAAKLTVRTVAATAAAPAAAAATPGAAAAQPTDAGVEALRKAAGSGEARAEIPLETRVRYFLAEGGATRVVVVIAVKRELVAAEPAPTVKLYARFRATEAPDAQPVEFLDQDLFTKQDDPDEGFVQYAFSWPLRKKNYELRTGLAVTTADGTTKTGTRVDTLELPAFKPEVLALSSVTLARVATQVAADAAAKDAFAVGLMHLVPWISPMLGPKDDLSFFYDVYGAKRDPASNKPALDL